MNIDGPSFKRADWILPSAFDPEVTRRVARAVAGAA